MDIGSDVGKPLTGTGLSIWPVPKKAEHAPESLASVQSEKLTVGTGTKKLSFDDLYTQYYPRVLAYLRFRTGTVDVAEELVSLVFERALIHLSDLQAPGA